MKFNPNNPEDWFGRGCEDFSNENFYSAIINFNKAIELNFENYGCFFKRGRSFYELKKYEDALKDFNKSIELSPNDSDSYRIRGNCYFELKKYEEAIKDFNISIELSSKDYSSYLKRGNCYFELEKYEEAIKDFTQAIKLGPKDYSYFFKRGNCYFELKKYEEAIKDFNISIELSSKDYSSYLKRGNCYFELEKYEEAIKDFTQAIILDPKKEENFSLRGSSKFHLGFYKDAIKDLNRAFDLIFTEDENAYQTELFVVKGLSINYRFKNRKYHEKLFFYRAESFFQLAKYSKALCDYKRLILFDRNNEFYLYRCVQCLSKGGRYYREIFSGGNHNYQIIFLTNKLIKLDSNNFKYYQIRGYAFYQLSEYVEAKANALKGIELNPTDHFSFILCGSISQSLEEYSEAVKYYDEALNLDPNNEYNNCKDIIRWKNECKLKLEKLELNKKDKRSQ